MGITLTNLPGFVESVATRQINSSVGKLDQMVVTLRGPQFLASIYTPSKGQPHAEYPLMFVKDSSVHDTDGPLCSISITYSGRIDARGNAFTSEKLTEFSSSEKELSWQQRFQIGFPINQPTTLTPVVQYQWHIGTDTYVHRYITKDATYKYVTSPKPVGPKFDGSETSITSEYDRWTGRGSGEWLNGNINGPSQTPIQGPMGFIGPVTRCTQFSAVQVIGGWYECSETWESRYEIGR